jgi:hypothetical protein
VKLTIDPETLLIAGDAAKRAYSAAEFAALESPDCPVCHLPATVQRLDVTLNAEDERLNGRSYIVGLWDCPRGCDPRTGRRCHSSQTFGKGLDGWRFACSCEGGAEHAGLSDAEFAALRREHDMAGGAR